MKTAAEMRKITDDAIAAAKAKCLEAAKTFCEDIVEEKLDAKANNREGISDHISVPMWISIQLVIEYLEDIGYKVARVGGTNIVVQW